MSVKQTAQTPKTKKRRRAEPKVVTEDEIIKEDIKEAKKIARRYVKACGGKVIDKDDYSFFIEFKDGDVLEVTHSLFEFDIDLNRGRNDRKEVE